MAALPQRLSIDSELDVHGSTVQQCNTSHEQASFLRAVMSISLYLVTVANDHVARKRETVKLSKCDY